MSMARYLFTVAAYKDTRGYGTADTGVRTMLNRQPMPKNEAAIKSFLRTSRITSKAVISPAYYGDLLTWALKRYMERERWQTAGILGNHYSEPVYIEISTDYHETERALVDGQLLIENGAHRLTATIDVRRHSWCRVMIAGSASSDLEVKKFVDGIKAVVEKENYYRNKKIEFDGRIRFFDVFDETWENICVKPEVKAQIKASTIGSLRQWQGWTSHGLPLKRCVLIEGETGKEAICRAVMTEASDVTCITTDASKLDYGRVTELYHLAQDLSPCIVFIMNIDRFSQKRMKPDCKQGLSLISLLTILGSVEEYEKIATVATTGYANSFGTVVLC